jgi:DNA-binding HxlR family transcriptional regulator
MATPRPGARVRGSRSGRPIMAALDLLGRRWALRILWELRAGPLSFRALRAACGDVSPAVLNTRLAELRDAGVLETTEAGYATTAAGSELCDALEPLSRWAQRWCKPAKPARSEP